MKNSKEKRKCALILSVIWSNIVFFFARRKSEKKKIYMYQKWVYELYTDVEHNDDELSGGEKTTVILLLSWFDVVYSHYSSAHKYQCYYYVRKTPMEMANWKKSKIQRTHATRTHTHSNCYVYTVCFFRLDTLMCMQYSTAPYQHRIHMRRER